jgi:hypothetical protein
MPTDRQRLHKFFREQRQDWRKQRRRQAAQGPLPLIIIGLGVALYFVFAIIFPIIAAILIYGTFTGMLVGLIVSEYRARPRPSVTREKQLRELETFSQDEISALGSLEEQQEELRRRKAEIYRQGNQSGLIRRQSDGRFDARGQGRAFNARLVKFDSHFEALADEIMAIKLKSANRRQQQLDEFTEWQPKNNLVIALRSALIAYIGCALVLAIYNPPILQQLSQFVVRHIWFYVPFLAAVYGPLALASMLSLATFLVSRATMSELSIEVDTNHIKEERDSNIEMFMTAEAEPDPEEHGPRADADSDEDEKDDELQSPHEILGVPINATRDQIMAAYRGLIKQYHPDFQQNRGAKLKQVAENESQLLNWAKEEALKRC